MIKKFNSVEEAANEERKIPKGYVSKKGFVKVPVLRGFYEISTLYKYVTILGGFICGGYVRYMCSPATTPHKAADVDIYAYNEDVFNKMKKFFSKELSVRYENDNAITYVRPIDREHQFFASPPIQLIKPIHEGRMVAVGDMQTILENFDFTIIRAGLIDNKTALVDADFDHDELNNILRLKNIHCPISSTLRCMKYSAKGYWLPSTQCIKLFADWDARDDDYIEKIIEFLNKAEADGELTQADIDEFEKLARID